MKRQLDEEEESAALNILAHLPPELIVQFFKNGGLAIADALMLAHTHVLPKEMYDEYVWNDIYRTQFSDIIYREDAEDILEKYVTFRHPLYPISVQLQFELNYMRIINVIIHEYMNNKIETANIVRGEAIRIVSAIYGSPGPQRLVTWDRKVPVLAPILRKMVIYRFLEAGWTHTESKGGDAGICCQVCYARGIQTKCNNCQIPLCGQECLIGHICRKTRNH